MHSFTSCVALFYLSFSFSYFRFFSRLSIHIDYVFPLLSCLRFLIYFVNFFILFFLFWLFHIEDIQTTRDLYVHETIVCTRNSIYTGFSMPKTPPISLSAHPFQPLSRC